MKRIQKSFMIEDILKRDNVRADGVTLYFDRNGCFGSTDLSKSSHEDTSSIDQQSYEVSSSRNKESISERVSRRARRSRTVFTDYQLKILEQRFLIQKYLSSSDRFQLAKILDLNQLQIKTWYQNRRMKWKKQVLENGATVAPTKPKGRPRKNTIPSLQDMQVALQFPIFPFIF